MVEIDVPDVTEGPWIKRYDGAYFVSYAYQLPGKIACAAAAEVKGPYGFRRSGAVEPPEGAVGTG